MKVEVIKGPMFEKLVKQAQVLIVQKALVAYGSSGMHKMDKKVSGK